MSKTVFEINNLNKAVNDFSEEMKARLAEQAARGKRGWDTDDVQTLTTLLVSKFNEGKTRDSNWLLDIANYSMFVHKAIEEGRPLYHDDNTNKE
jgi:hypothetical protein